MTYDPNQNRPILSLEEVTQATEYYTRCNFHPDMLKCAEGNDDKAQLHLACAYLNGNNVTKDVTAGMQWMERSGKTNVLAKFFLFNAISTGHWSVVKDLPRAIEYLIQAADESFVMAQVLLSNIYLIGPPEFAPTISASLENAHKYAMLAARQGSPEGQFMVAQMMFEQLEPYANNPDAYMQGQRIISYIGFLGCGLAMQYMELNNHIFLIELNLGFPCGDLSEQARPELTELFGPNAWLGYDTTID